MPVKWVSEEFIKELFIKVTRALVNREVVFLETFWEKMSFIKRVFKADYVCHTLFQAANTPIV